MNKFLGVVFVICVAVLTTIIAILIVKPAVLLEPSGGKVLYVIYPEVEGESKIEMVEYTLGQYNVPMYGRDVYPANIIGCDLGRWGHSDGYLVVLAECTTDNPHIYLSETPPSLNLWIGYSYRVPAWMDIGSYAKSEAREMKYGEKMELLPIDAGILTLRPQGTVEANPAYQCRFSRSGPSYGWGFEWGNGCAQLHSDALVSVEYTLKYCNMGADAIQCSRDNLKVILYNNGTLSFTAAESFAPEYRQWLLDLADARSLQYDLPNIIEPGFNYILQPRP